ADAGLGDGDAGPAAPPLPPVRRALGAGQPGRLPHERREPLPDGRPRDHRRRGSAPVRPAVRRARAPRPRRGQGADGLAQTEEVSAESPPLPVSDPEPRRLDLPHGVLAYTDEGPRGAPALIAVHGIPGSGRDFRYLAPQLTPDVRVLRVDLPGFGGSAPVEDAVATLRGRARVVLALADALGLERFAVAGHSMGGGAALVLAAD